MKKIIQFKISKESVDLAIVTNGVTLKHLKENIIEEISLHEGLTTDEVMHISQSSGSFSFLNDEPDLYTFKDATEQNH